MLINDSFRQLPLDNALQIFSNLSVQDLARCCQVSKLWRDVASKDILWKQLLPTIDFPVAESCKQYVDRHALRSKSEILAHLKKFFGTMSVNQSASYSCVFPFNTDCELTAKMEYVYQQASPTREIKEIGIFMRTLECLPEESDTRQNHGYNDVESNHIQSTNRQIKGRMTLPPDNSFSNSEFMLQMKSIILAQAKQLARQVQRHQWKDLSMKLAATGAFFCLAYSVWYKATQPLHSI